MPCLSARTLFPRRRQSVNQKRCFHHSQRCRPPRWLEPQELPRRPREHRRVAPVVRRDHTPASNTKSPQHLFDACHARHERNVRDATAACCSKSRMYRNPAPLTTPSKSIRSLFGSRPGGLLPRKDGFPGTAEIAPYYGLVLALVQVKLHVLRRVGAGTSHLRLAELRQSETAFQYSRDVAQLAKRPQGNDR